MGICENVQYLCKKHKLPISNLEKALELSNGSIRRWDESSPSADKVKKVADYFGVSADFIIYGFDKEIVEIIKDLAATDNKKTYFPAETKEILDLELEPVKKEYWDVPLDLEPIELIGLIKEFPVTTEFKEAFLSVLKQVKQKVAPSISAIAAHHDGEDWTEEELKSIEEFKDFVRSKRKKNKKGLSEYE